MRGRAYRYTNNKVLTVLIILGLIMGILIGAGFALINTRLFAQEDGQGLAHGNKTDFNTQRLDDMDDDSINFLIIGVDDSKLMTDVIMIVNLDTINDRISVLQIPRDTYVGDDVITDKINAVYSHPKENQSKISSLISTINEKFKLTIDHYATITFEGFIEVIDVLGGVEMDVEKRISYGPGDSLFLETGNQLLDGEKALGYMRHRKSYAEGDLGRVKARTAFLEELVNMVYNVSAIEATQIARKCFDKITTDLTLKEVMNYYYTVNKIDKSEINFFILDGTAIKPSYNGYAIYAVDKEKTAELLNIYFRPNSPSVSAAALPLTDHNELSDYFYGASGGKTNNNSNKTTGNEDEDDEFPTSSQEDLDESGSKNQNENEQENPWWGKDEESGGEIAPGE